MTARSFMTFATHVVARADDQGRDMPPPGKELASALAQGLERCGFTITEQVGEHGSYGWYFVVRTAAGKRVWCMLQQSDQWLLITEPLLPLLHRLLHRFFRSAEYARAHRQVCQALDAAAREHEGVSGIQWFSRQDFEAQQPGVERP